MTATTPTSIAAERSRRAAIAAALTGTNLVVIALGVMHILVWDPLAKVPGLPLDQIYERMRAADEGDLASMFVAQWAMFWGIFSLAYLLVYLLPVTAGFLSKRGMTALGLLMVGFTSLGSWLAGFNMGMSLADTFMIGGGSRAPSGPLILLIGAISIVAAVWVAVRPLAATPAASEAAADA
jgi:hypothetical protein